MELQINGKNISVNLIWLRDNCRCRECFNYDTSQKKQCRIETGNIRIKEYSIRENRVRVTWNDGHYSEYNLNWIENQQAYEIRPHEILWSRDEILNHPSIITEQNVAEYDDGIKLIIKSVLQFGVAVVKNVPLTIEAFNNVIAKIGPIMQTLYGGIWSVHANKSDLQSYQDTAYTDEELAVHTDNTYFFESAGLIIFHCLKQASDGGETVLVDGFKAIRILQESNTDFYNCLKTTPIEWQYVSTKHHHTCIKPIINTYSNANRLKQIRFNMYDRSARVPFVSAGNLNTFYSSLKCFTKILKNPNLEWKIQLTPGTMIVINNWRVLHGRKKFSGSRNLIGCYIGMNSFLGKARMLKLII